MAEIQNQTPYQLNRNICFSILLVPFLVISTMMFKSVNDDYLSSQMVFEKNVDKSASQIFHEVFVVLDPMWEDRRFVEGNRMHNRHLFRWIGKTAQSRLLAAVGSRFGITAERHFYVFMHGILMTATLAFCLLALAPGKRLSGTWISILAAASLLFAAHTFYLSIIRGWAEDYTFKEALLIAVALCCIARRSFIGFLIASVLAVMVRESGLAISVFWVVDQIARNSRFRFRDIVPPFVCGGVLVVFNLDLFAQPEYWDLATYITGAGNQLDLLNIAVYEGLSRSEKLLSVLFMVSCFFPSVVLVFTGMTPIARSYMGFAMIYTVVVLVGTDLQNSFVYFLLTPIWTILLGIVLQHHSGAGFDSKS